MVSRAMRPARVEKQEHHFTIHYAVWMGGTSIAYFDSELRADLVCRALNFYRKTPAGRKWYQRQCPANDLKLSDCPARRDGCAGEGGGAAGVTRGAVRSSAWLGDG